MVAFGLLRASFVALAFLAPATLAAPTGNTTVVTPYGEFPASQVVAIPEGGSLVHKNGEVRLLDQHGKLVHVSKHDVNAPNPKGKGVLPAEQNGWAAYAYWYNQGAYPIQSFTTDWVVPRNPKTNHRQVVFLFNSIEPATGTAILQPVLQWGPSAAGGGPFWAVASWYVIGNTAYHTWIVRVSVGQVLRGVILLTGTTAAGRYNYASYFSNVARTTLLLKGSPQLVWATETLESYHLAGDTDYPTGSTVFSNINIRTTQGIPAVTWTPVNNPPDKLFTTINRQGALNARVTIRYPRLV